MLKPSGGIRSLPSLSAWGLQRRLLPLPVSVMLIFGCFLVQVVEGVLQKEPLGICRGRCPHRPADLPEDSNFLVQPRRNRPAEFARCPRCPPGACQRRWLPLPVFVMLIFRCFLVQAGNFILYGVCKFICLSSFMYNRFHKELRFFFSLLKRKKEAKKEKSSRFPCTVRQCITRRLHKRFSPTKLPRRGEQAACPP